MISVVSGTSTPWKRPFGWVSFFYVPRQYLRTGDINELRPLGSGAFGRPPRRTAPSNISVPQLPAREIETYDMQWRGETPRRKVIAPPAKFWIRCVSNAVTLEPLKRCS